MLERYGIVTRETVLAEAHEIPASGPSTAA